MTDAAQIDRGIDCLLRYMCCGRDSQVAGTRVKQALCDRLYEAGFSDGHKLLTGSKFEGMPWEVCGDVDFMICYRLFPVVVPQQPLYSAELSKESHCVFAVANDSEPAYLNIIVGEEVMKGVAREFDFDSDFDFDLAHLTSPDGFLRSDLFVQHTFSKRSDSCQTSGPAATSHVFAGHPQYGHQDLVPCLKSPSWPPVATEFLVRRRQYGWPSAEMLSQLPIEGCYVVAKSHDKSANRHKEWRWSFSVAERLLADSMCTEMICCLYALKVIKNKFFVGDGSASSNRGLCSYYIKTACMWILETKQVAELNISELCHAVLAYLIDAYRSGRLDHFFIPKQNLLSHLDPAEMNTVLQKLIWVTDNFSNCLIESVPFDEPNQLDGNCFVKQLMSEKQFLKQWKLIEGTLHQGGQAFQLQHSRLIGYWSNGYFRELYDVLETTIGRGRQEKDVIQMTEDILLPIVECMDKIMPQGSAYGETCCRTIYRYLGELLFSVSTYFMPDRMENDLASRITKYYQLGGQYHPDGWEDDGLTSHVLEAKYYFLRGQWDSLDNVCEAMLPKLEKYKTSARDLNRLSIIKIITNLFLSTLPWLSAKEFREMIETGEVIFLYFNPVVLGYYIVGSSRKRTGRSYQKELSGMDICGDLLVSSRQRYTANKSKSLLKESVKDKSAIDDK